MAAMIEAILADLRSKNKFGLITRYDYTSRYSVEDIMAEIEAVGKFRSTEFVIDADNRFAYTNLAKWILGDPTMECIDPATRTKTSADIRKGIYLAGSTGTGKSWAMEIIGYLAGAHGFKCKVFGKEEPLFIVNTHVSAALERFTDNQEPITHRIVCFNDLGTEPREAVYMGNRQDVMRSYIEERAECQYLVTCFTSNYPINHEFITERYGDRAVSRLRQMCNYLELRGKDRRK